MRCLSELQIDGTPDADTVTEVSAKSLDAVVLHDLGPVGVAGGKDSSEADLPDVAVGEALVETDRVLLVVWQEAFLHDGINDIGAESIEFSLTVHLEDSLGARTASGLDDQGEASPLHQCTEGGFVRGENGFGPG